MASTDTAKKAPAKKAAAKKTPAKKAAESSSVSGVKLGDQLYVATDPKFNNGGSEAPAVVTQVLNVKGETRVNLRVLLDNSDADMHVRNVLVVTRSAAKKAEANGQHVAFKSPSN